MSGIIAFLQALPRILALMERIGQWIEDKKLNAWIDDLESTIDLLENAKGASEKREAARGLVRLVRNLK